MNVNRGSIFRWVTILAAALLLGTVGAALVGAKGKQPTKTDGGYDVTVGGYYAGTGSISVVSKTVSITATVTSPDSAGSTVALAAPDLTLNGDHFLGTGTIGGLAVRIQGRLDGYDSDADFHGARVLATYADSAGHRGRIAGTLTSPPPAPATGGDGSGSSGSGGGSATPPASPSSPPSQGPPSQGPPSQGPPPQGPPPQGPPPPPGPDHPPGDDMRSINPTFSSSPQRRIRPDAYRRDHR